MKTPFKIGQLVQVDTVIGTSRPARIESMDIAARSVRVLYIDTGERQEGVRFGDIALSNERVRWTPGDRPPDAVGIDYSNPAHHRALVANIYSEKDRDTGET